jgi:hypothetical protein
MIISLVFCGFVFSGKSTEITNNINKLLQSRSATNEQTFLCVDEIVLERASGLKRTEVFVTPRPLKLFLVKNNYVQNVSKIMIRELDKTCAAGN